MNDSEQNTAIYIIAAVLGSVALIFLIGLIILQIQLSKVKRLAKKLSQDELKRRGFEEYNGTKNLQQQSTAQPQQPIQHQQPYSGHVSPQAALPPLQSQYPAQNYNHHGGPSSIASSIVRDRGYHEYTPPHPQYQNQGYDRDRRDRERDRGFSPGIGGVQVLPRDDSDIFQDHRGNFVLKSPPNKYANEAKDFAKDVAKDVAQDLAKDGIKDGWNKMWG